MRKLINATVIDDLIDAYVDWGEESAEVEYAYRRWSVTPSPGAALAFAAYAAALDREELASIRYARLVRRAFVLLARDRRRRRRPPMQRAVRGRGAGRRGRRRMRRLAREAGSRAGRTRTV
jgi:hypothetical protein